MSDQAIVMSSSTRKSSKFQEVRIFSLSNAIAGNKTKLVLSQRKIQNLPKAAVHQNTA